MKPLKSQEMLEIWKPTVGSSQNLGKVFAVEEAQDRMFLGEKPVSTVRFEEGTGLHADSV